MSTEKAHLPVFEADVPIRALPAGIRPKSGLNGRLVEDAPCVLVERNSAGIFYSIMLNASVAPASPEA